MVYGNRINYMKEECHKFELDTKSVSTQVNREVIYDVKE